MKINTPDKYSPSVSCNSKETVRQLSISALGFYSEENNNFLPPFWWLVYFHLAGDEWQAYFVSHETKCFSMCSKGFHSSAYLTTSEKFNHAICSKSRSDCYRLFLSFLNYNLCPHSQRNIGFITEKSNFECLWSLFIGLSSFSWLKKKK